MKQISQDNVKRYKDSGNFLVRYFKSFIHALEGILYAIRYEHNLIIIIAAIIVSTTLGFIYKVNEYEWLFIIISIALVSGVEMINTSIEAVVDLVTEEKKPLAKIAKDAAASATLIFSVMAFIGALIIFIPKIF